MNDETCWPGEHDTTTVHSHGPAASTVCRRCGVDAEVEADETDVDRWALLKLIAIEKGVW